MTSVDIEYIAQQVVNLCRIPSPTGFAHEAIAYVETELNRLGIATRRTPKGALLATLPGRDTEHQRALSAHVDTLGAMVKAIKPNGRLKLHRIGGYPWQTIEGEYVTVHPQSGRTVTGTVLLTKASVHVHGQEVDRLERNEETLEVRLDERVHNQSGVEALGIQVGDFVSFDPRTVRTPAGFIKSRHLDDKACAAILLGLARQIQTERIPLAATTHLFFSNYEEVGHGAAGVFPPEVAELVAVDMAAMGEGQASDEYSVTICVMDSSGPYDYELSSRLRQIAAEKGIPFKVDIYPRYGSDASAALRAGGQFRTALVGPGIDASHSFERCHLDGLKYTAALLLEYLKQ